MSRPTEQRWRLSELVTLSTHIQAVSEVSGHSRRVRWEPNERLVRYYTSLGLLDRPAEMRGRTAYYGVRHLLQMLAVKVMQARGNNLHEIQVELTGRSNRELQELAGLPENWQQSGPMAWEPLLEPERPSAKTREHGSPTEAQASALAPPSQASQPSQAPDRFWERRPAPVPPAREDDPITLPLQGLELAPGVVLTLDRRRYPRLDPRQIGRLAAPLLEALQAWNEAPTSKEGPQ